MAEKVLIVKVCVEVLKGRDLIFFSLFRLFYGKINSCSDRLMLRFSGKFQPVCTSDGLFEPIQCRAKFFIGVKCWCSDPHGRKIREKNGKCIWINNKVRYLLDKFHSIFQRGEQQQTIIKYYILHYNS